MAGAQESHITSSTSVGVAAVAASAYVAGMYFVETFPSSWPFSRMWGLHAPVYLPFGFTVLAGCLVVASAIPRVNAIFTRVLERSGDAVVRGLGSPAGGGFALAGAVLLFWFFRQAYPFLGDGLVRIGDVASGAVQSQGRGVIETLSAFCRLTGLDARTTIQLFSIAMGVPFLVGAYRLARLVSVSASRITPVFSVLVLCGCLQFYFGYVEMYAPIPVVVVFALAWGIEALREASPPWKATCALVAGVLLHPLAALLVPAVSLLWVFYVRRGARERAGFTGAMTLGGCAAAGALGAGLVAPELFLPLFPGATGYSVLSGAHLVEVVNAVLLSAPGGAVLFVFTAAAGNRSAWRPETVFTGCAALPFLAASASFDLVLGSLDWDLHALGGVAFTAFALLLVRDRVAAHSDRAYALTFALAFGAVNTLSFVALNASERSVARVGDILSTDPASYHRSHPFEVTYGTMLSEVGRNREAVEVYERGFERTGDERLAMNAGRVYVDLGEHASADVAFGKALDVKPDYPEARFGQVMSRIVVEDYAGAVASMGRMRPESLGALSAEDRDALSRNLEAVGFRLSQQGRPEDAVRAWQYALVSDDSRPGPYHRLGVVYSMLGEYARAIDLFEQGLTRTPAHPDLMRDMGVALDRMGQVDRAIETYNRYLETASDPDVARRRDQLAAALGRTQTGTQPGTSP